MQSNKKEIIYFNNNKNLNFEFYKNIKSSKKIIILISYINVNKI
jgi:hypothetical protein